MKLTTLLTVLMLAAMLSVVSGCTFSAEQTIFIPAEDILPQSETTPIAVPAASIEPTPEAETSLTAEPVFSPDPTPVYTAVPSPEPTASAAPEHTPKAHPAVRHSKLGDEVLALVNSHREAAGLAPLKYASNVQKAANTRADECLSDFSHTRPDGSRAYTVLAQYGLSFTAFGENLFSATGMGDVSAEFMVNSWMDSPGHKANILGKDYTHMCIATSQQGDSIYAVQLFTAGAE